MRTAPELQLLAAAVVIGLVQLLWATVAGTRQRGDLSWGMGPRDEARPLSGVPARLERAFANFMETFPLFAAAVIVAYLAAKLGTLTLWGAGLYVAARALYVPLYAAGVPALRSLVWGVSLVGVLMVIAAIFL
ncbi:MAG: MAPEG family protein [Phenylobacterium sp.]|uniref:MAPEG family protein n=1 Tax=Phenylobacterium sp. TaxID=1871053 RepID=UPI00391C54FF